MTARRATALRSLAGVPLALGVFALLWGLDRGDGPRERPQLHVRKIATPARETPEVETPLEAEPVPGGAVEGLPTEPQGPAAKRWRLLGTVTRDGRIASGCRFGFVGFDADAEWGRPTSLIQRVEGATEPLSSMLCERVGAGRTMDRVTEPAAVGWTDHRGRFEVEGLGDRPPAAWWARVMGTTKGVATGEPVAEGGGDWSIALDIPTRGDVFGVVRDQEGRPVEARVWVTLPGVGHRSYGSPEPAAETRSNSFGEYRIEGVAAGRVLVWAAMEGASGYQNVTIPPFHGVGKDITVWPFGQGPGRHLRGTVAFAGGRFLPLTHLVLASRDTHDEPYCPDRATHAVTKDDGSWVMSIREPVAHREWALVLWSLEHAPVLRPISMPVDAHLEIHLKVGPGHRFAGHVLYRADGPHQYMETADVIVEAGHRRPDLGCFEMPGGLLRIIGDWVPRVSTTVKDGAFEFPHLPSLEARVEVLPPGERSDEGLEVTWQLESGPTTVSPPTYAEFRFRRIDPPAGNR